MRTWLATCRRSRHDGRSGACDAQADADPRDLEALKPIAGKGATSYMGDRIDQAVVERYLERAVGRMIDVNFHIITGAGHPPPTDYHASFLRLAEFGVLDTDFARRIARAAGLRNRLVHEYEEVDPRRVFEGLEAALRDVPVYASRVHAYLAGPENAR